MSPVHTPKFNPKYYPIPVDTELTEEDLHTVLHCFAERDSYYVVFEELNSGTIGLRRFVRVEDMGDFIDDLRENVDNPCAVLFIFHGKHYPAVTLPGPIYGGSKGIASTTLNIITLDERCCTYETLVGTDEGMDLDMEAWVAGLIPTEPQYLISAPKVAETLPQDN